MKKFICGVKFDILMQKIDGVDIPPSAFKVMYYLAQETPRVISRDDIFINCFGEIGLDRTIDKYLSVGRKTLGQPNSYKWRTVSGEGYRFE